MCSVGVAGRGGGDRERLHARKTDRNREEPKKRPKLCVYRELKSECLEIKRVQCTREGA